MLTLLARALLRRMPPACSIAESEFPFVFEHTPKRGRTGGSHLYRSLIENVSPIAKGFLGQPRREKGQTDSHARMFEDESGEDEDVEEGATGSEEVEEEHMMDHQDDMDYRTCKTPRQKNHEALLAWLHLQRRCACEWNYLIIGAATRIQVRGFVYLVGALTTLLTKSYSLSLSLSLSHTHTHTHTLKADWRSFCLRKRFNALKISSRRLLEYARAVLVHGAIADRIAMWLEQDTHTCALRSVSTTASSHLPIYSHADRKKSSPCYKSPKTMRGSRQPRVTYYDSPTSGNSAHCAYDYLKSSSYCTPSARQRDSTEEEEEDALLRELDLIRYRVASVTPARYPHTPPHELRRLYSTSQRHDESDGSDTELQLSSLRKQ